MSRDYQGPYYSLDDLRSVIDAMCKSIESSGLIDEHEHPSAYSALLDTSKWMADLEGQEPTAWMNAKRDMASFIHFHEDDLPLFARPVPVEPVNVDFGTRGENMFFQIGNQSFLLDYKPEEQGEFEFMKAMLLSAFSRITHGVKTESQPVNARILDVSTGKLEHINAGLCPDSINGPDSRDPATDWADRIKARGQK